MANITSQMVKELREMTQAGMMDCKKALVEAEGEMEKAIEWLREKGLAAAAKKAGRIAAEGAVIDYVTEDKTVGAIVEVNCETDFVANTDNFKNFCKNIAKHIALSNPVDVDELMNQKFVDDESKTITDLVSDATVSIGEKISIRRFARYQTNCGVVETYIHMGGKIGVLLLVENNNPATFGADAFRTFYHDVALQIAAAKPSYVRKEEVPTEALNKEREILRAQALNEGKPEKIVDKMVEGRIEKYYKGGLPPGAALRQGSGQVHRQADGRGRQGDRRGAECGQLRALRARRGYRKAQGQLCRGDCRANGRQKVTCTR